MEMGAGSDKLTSIGRVNRRDDEKNENTTSKAPKPHVA